MFGTIRAWLDRRIIRQSQISDSEWRHAFEQLPLLQRLPDAERKRLTSLAILLLHRKQFSGAHDLVVDRHMQLVIALQACEPIVNLDIGWYRNWHSIIVNPEGFAA